MNIEQSLVEMNRQIEHILNHIDNMNEMTQAQAALTEELNASIEEINSMIHSLVDIVREI